MNRFPIDQVFRVATREQPNRSSIDSEIGATTREQPNRFLIDQQIGSGARTAVNRFSIDWETESILNRLDEQIWVIFKCRFDLNRWFLFLSHLMHEIHPLYTKNSDLLLLSSSLSLSLSPLLFSQSSLSLSRNWGP